MTDTDWQRELSRLDALDLLAQAECLDDLAAWQRNKIMDTGVSSAVGLGRIQECYDRVERTADILGEPAREAFAGGFDDAINFSLNGDWREAERQTAGELRWALRRLRYAVEAIRRRGREASALMGRTLEAG